MLKIGHDCSATSKSTERECRGDRDDMYVAVLNHRIKPPKLKEKALVELVERRECVKSSRNNFLHTTSCPSRKTSMTEEPSNARKRPTTGSDQKDEKARNPIRESSSGNQLEAARHRGEERLSSPSGIKEISTSEAALVSICRPKHSRRHWWVQSRIHV